MPPEVRFFRASFHTDTNTRYSFGGFPKRLGLDSDFFGGLKTDLTGGWLGRLGWLVGPGSQRQIWGLPPPAATSETGWGTYPKKIPVDSLISGHLGRLIINVAGLVGQPTVKLVAIKTGNIIPS